MLSSLLFSLVMVTLVILLWPARHHKLFVAGTAFVFLAASFGLYAFLGAPDILPLLEARNQKIAEVKSSMLKHSEQVKANPKDLDAWVGLGQDFIESGQWEAATNAFKQAVLLSKGDPLLIMAYAKSMILAENGQVSDQTKKSLEMVVLQQPQHEEARYWLIVKKLQDGKTEEAMKAMKELYASLPDGSPVKEMIDRQIGKKP